jgi:hypothetical protein
MKLSLLIPCSFALFNAAKFGIAGKTVKFIPSSENQLVRKK